MCCGSACLWDTAAASGASRRRSSPGAMIAFFWMAGIATSDAPWARELIERGNDERTLWMCMIGGFVYAYLARLAGLVTMGELREEEPRADRN